MNGEEDTVIGCVSGNEVIDETPKDSTNTRLEDTTEWVYTPPPDNQREFEFPEDGLSFSSRFDSGNLIQVERIGPFRYNMYTSPDCGNSPKQTNNRQWFHFAIRGGSKGTVITFTFVGMMHCKMFTYGWMPVMAVCPGKPQYTRLPGRATVVALDAMPPTPGYPGFVFKPWEKKLNSTDNAATTTTTTTSTTTTTTTTTVEGGNDDGDANGSSEGVPDVIELAPTATTKKKKKENSVSMNLTFDVRLEIEAPLNSSLYPLGNPQCPATYIASNHPYSYTTLQNNIKNWKTQASGGTRNSGTEESAENDVGELDSNSIYFNHEILCKSLDGRNIDLITITDRSGISTEKCPFYGDEDIPYSSAMGETERPYQFLGKPFVVLSARVHPGETPSSHLMHGCIEFLLNQVDPRAIALRSRFVFLLVPMINPDGVVRGHSRADTDGVNLNRMYKNPSKTRHPAPYSIRSMLHSIASVKGRLNLFIDMHAHSNKRGMFFYGNSMEPPELLQGLSYAKLVALNTPYFEFQSSNFSEANMYATGKTGESRDTSSRVTLYQETGLVYSYTIEASYVVGNTLNGVTAISTQTVEEPEVFQGTPSPKYSPAIFADVGKGLLVALLDLKGCNPLSRLTTTQYHNAKGVTLALQRQLQTEVSERLFKIAFANSGQTVLSRDSSVDPLVSIMSTLKPEDFLNAMTIKDGRGLPAITIRGFSDFLSLDQAIQILAHTPPLCPPRSLICNTGRRSLALTVAAAAGGGGGGPSGRRCVSNSGNNNNNNNNSINNNNTTANAALRAPSASGRKSLTGVN